jgi:hypothetical protein
MSTSDGGRRHLLNDKMYAATKRVAFKGQVFSAPMDWTSMLQQLDTMDKHSTHGVLPKIGQVLASEVRVSIDAGLVSLKDHIKEVTVRRNVVVQLIRLFKDAEHPDCAKPDMAAVELRSKKLADSHEPSIPNGLAEILASDDEKSDDGAPDKAATPAERIRSKLEFQSHMDRTRSQIQRLAVSFFFV